MMNRKERWNRLSEEHVRAIMGGKGSLRKLIPWQIGFIVASLFSYMLTFTIFDGWLKQGALRIAVQIMSSLGAIVVVGLGALGVFVLSPVAKSEKKVLLSACLAAFLALAAVVIGSEAALSQASPTRNLLWFVLVIAIPIACFLISRGVAAELKLSRELTNLSLIVEVATIFISINTIMLFSALPLIKG